MSDERIVEYLRARGHVEPPFDLVESIADAVAEAPQRRTSLFTAWVPAVAALGAAAVIAILTILLGQQPNIGPSPAPSGSPAPSASSTSSPDVSAVPGGDLTQPGSRVTIDAVDEDGTWGSITLTREPDIAAYPGSRDQNLFLVQVFVEYEPSRLPSPEQFGASDWLLRPTDRDAEHFFLVGPAHDRATEEDWPAQERLLGQYPGAVDIMTTAINGLIQFPVSIREANLELELVYAPPVGGGEIEGGVGAPFGSASIRIRTPGPAPEPLPTPTPAPGEAGYVEQPGLPFSVLDNADADALFVGADTCTNPVDGYTVSYPDSWYTNTEVGDVPACSWFTPQFFEVTEPGTVPEEIWIEVAIVDGVVAYTSLTEVHSNEEVVIGGRAARRVEFNPSPTGQPDFRGYHYVIDLGEGSGTGRSFLAQTDTDVAGDYVLAKAVLDRMMASLEFAAEAP
jgi:hypothetical protein